MPTEAAIREQVRRICRNISPMQGRLLRYIVEEFLAGRDLKEFSIAEGFFGYSVEEFFTKASDSKLPCIDHSNAKKTYDERRSNVRVALGNLRKRLVRYYDNADSNDFVHISLATRSYTPVIRSRFEELTPADRLKMGRANEAREHRTAEGFEEGIRTLQEILVQHPDHPVILGRLAELHSLRTLHAVLPTRPDLESACRYAEAAQAKSKKIWEAYAGLGGAYACLDWDWVKAENAFNEALDIIGIRVKSLPWYRAFLTSQGRFPELIGELEQVISDLADLGPSVRRNLGIAMMFSGDFDQAIPHLESAMPHHTAYLYLGMINEARGEYGTAVDLARMARARPGSEYVVPGFLILALARAGNRDEAVAEFTRLQAAPHYFSWFHRAIALLGLGETDHALDCLERACEEREFFVLWLSCWPTFRELHTHPRFRALLQMIGLPKPC